jgi:hypothetical protein
MKNYAASAADFSLSPNTVSVARKKAFPGPGSDKKEPDPRPWIKGLNVSFRFLQTVSLSTGTGPEKKEKMRKQKR